MEKQAKLVMHDDNTAMIQIRRSAKNPQMKSIGRTFGISIRSLHEATQRGDFELGPIQSENMVADIHTKHIPNLGQLSGAMSDEAQEYSPHKNFLRFSDLLDLDGEIGSKSLASIYLGKQVGMRLMCQPFR